MPLARFLTRALAAIAIAVSMTATAEPPGTGIVVMHGKGGSPTGYVANLARALEGKGYLVTNLEMAWSARRNYDVPVERAEEEVEAALSALRGKGAQKVFVAGHSQGGIFALHLAGKISADGFIGIAPGGDVGNRVFRDELGGAVARARKLIAEGKGEQQTALEDYEGRKGKYAINTTPALYLSWFEPEGAMSMQRAARAANPRIPILWIVPKNEHSGVRRANIALFDNLPRHALSKLYEPYTDHTGAPSASLDEIVRWIGEVAKTSSR